MGFQIAGILMLLLFYGCYFAKMANQRRRGIKTNQMGRGKTGLPQYIELSLKAVSCLVPVVEVVSIALDTKFLDTPARAAGLLIGGVGTLVFMISVITMRDSWRAGVSRGESTGLVTGGIYQISRNPAFLGFDLVYIGIGMTFFNWILWIVSCLAMLLFHLQIVNVEEVFLLEAFGDEYSSYQKRVCRYLGRKKIPADCAERSSPCENDL